MYGLETDEFSEQWAPYAVAALRIVTALLFLEHGTATTLGFPAIPTEYPPAWSLTWVTGWAEIIGGVLLLVGLFTRWVALLLALEMVVVYFYIYAGTSPYPLVNQGETPILFAFIFIALAVIGAGEFSIDKIRAKNRSHIVGYEAPGGERTYNNE
jgi:putative oxidoreductase